MFFEYAAVFFLPLFSFIRLYMYVYIYMFYSNPCLITNFVVVARSDCCLCLCFFVFLFLFPAMLLFRPHCFQYYMREYMHQIIVGIFGASWLAIWSGLANEQYRQQATCAPVPNNCYSLCRMHNRKCVRSQSSKHTHCHREYSVRRSQLLNKAALKKKSYNKQHRAWASWEIYSTETDKGKGIPKHHKTHSHVLHRCEGHETESNNNKNYFQLEFMQVF